MINSQSWKDPLKEENSHDSPRVFLQDNFMFQLVDFCYKEEMTSISYNVVCRTDIKATQKGAQQVLQLGQKYKVECFAPNRDNTAIVFYSDQYDDHLGIYDLTKGKVEKAKLCDFVVNFLGFNSTQDKIVVGGYEKALLLNFPSLKVEKQFPMKYDWSYYHIPQLDLLIGYEDGHISLLNYKTGSAQNLMNAGKTGGTIEVVAT